MNGACLPAARGGGDPTVALAAALELVACGTDQLRAAMEVEWEAPAAELYRAAVGEAVHAVARDLTLLEEAMRRAAAYLAAGGPG
jgi:hypothetical protein